MTATELNSISEDQMAAAAAKPTMPRDILPKLRFHNDFATIIKGIRRCGKSTLTHQWRQQAKERVIALNFDDLRMMGFSTGDFKVLDHVLSEKKPAAIILDEIHTVEGWELFVRQKLDQGFKVLVTGSNAALLSRELGTKLTGRHIDIETTPFTYPEFLRFTNHKSGLESLKSYIQQGGFPAFLKTNDTDVLKELVNDIIYKDIAVRHSIRDTRPLRNLCLFLLGSAAKKISPSRLKEAMHVKSATTMLEYFNYFEDTYLVCRLETFSESTKARLLAPKKIYIADTALAYALNASQSPDLGNMLENMVFCHLKRRSDELYYHDDGTSECDFIAKNANGYSVTQVTWDLNDDNKEREFKGLTHALDRLGMKEGTIVTANQSDFAVIDGFTINIIPAAQFLTERNRQ